LDLKDPGWRHGEQGAVGYVARVSSPFLQVPESEWVASNAQGFALRDRYPVSPGHTLVIPRRPVATWFEATKEEQCALFELVEEVKRGLDAEYQPFAYCERNQPSRAKSRQLTEQLAQRRWRRGTRKKQPPGMLRR